VSSLTEFHLLCFRLEGRSQKPLDCPLRSLTNNPRICYCTAASAIYYYLQIPLPYLPGGATTGADPKSILVLGGSSGVGAAAIQILRLSLPSAEILTTSSPKHHGYLSSLGASQAFDRTSPTLIADIKAATPEGKGVDMILDAVSSSASQPDIFDTLRADGLKEYAEVFTGTPTHVHEGVKRHVVFGRKLFDTQGGENVMPALAELLRKGDYKIPIKVKTVGRGFETIAPGLEELKKGVSLTKLVVTV
jgi:NADPH:quinone reductase-like Zn-dependent oxidoreductase